MDSERALRQTLHPAGARNTAHPGTSAASYMPGNVRWGWDGVDTCLLAAESGSILRPMAPPRFRTRLFLTLSLFAVSQPPSDAPVGGNPQHRASVAERQRRLGPC